MKKVILFGIILLVSINVAIAVDKHYSLELNYRDDIVAFRGINLVAGEMLEVLDEGHYELRLTSFIGDLLYKRGFDIGEEGDFILYLPYYEEAEEVVIFDGRERIFDYDIGSFADVCGDSKCQDHESYESCAEDCPSGSMDDYCDGVDDDRCDPDCGLNDPDCVGGQEITGWGVEEDEFVEEKPGRETIQRKIVRDPVRNLYLLYYIVLPLIILTGIGVGIAVSEKSKARKQKEEEVLQYIDVQLKKGYSPQQIKMVLKDYGYDEGYVDGLIRRF